MTVFEPHGDKAYIDGFFLSKAKGDANAVKSPMAYQPDHQRARRVEMARQPEVERRRRRTGGRAEKAPPSILRSCQKGTHGGR